MFVTSSAIFPKATRIHRFLLAFLHPNLLFVLYTCDINDLIIASGVFLDLFSHFKPTTNELYLDLR